MKDFGYARATDVASTVTVLSRGGATVIAGGTELLNWFRLGISDDDSVIDIGDISELRAISRHGDELFIGALATLNDVESHPAVNTGAAALASACRQAASAQVRNRATMGEMYCSAVAVRTSGPSNHCRGAATSVVRVAGVPRWRDITKGRPSSGGPRTASRCSRRTRRWRWPHWTLGSRSPVRQEAARSR